MHSFESKVVIVTGGGAGIGRAAALEFAAQGARVIVTGRRAGPLQALANAGLKITFTVADVAGAGAVQPLISASPEQVANIFAVNGFGPSLLATAAIGHLEATGGSIVNVSSTFGHKAVSALSHYAASNAALEHLTRCWALELAPLGVRVNAVAPGLTETDFLVERMGLSAAQAEGFTSDERARTPLGRRGAPEDVAHWIVALASPSAVWVTGQVVTVDGGLSIS